MWQIMNSCFIFELKTNWLLLSCLVLFSFRPVAALPEIQATNPASEQENAGMWLVNGLQ